MAEVIDEILIREVETKNMLFAIYIFDCLYTAITITEMGPRISPRALAF